MLLYSKTLLLSLALDPRPYVSVSDRLISGVMFSSNFKLQIIRAIIWFIFNDPLCFLVLKTWSSRADLQDLNLQISLIYIASIAGIDP